MVIKKLIGVAVLAGLALVAWNTSNKSAVADPRAGAQTNQEVSSLTQLMEASNSDGSLKLSGINEFKTGKMRYTFKVTDTQKKTSTLLYDMVADEGQTLTIPFNSWSSDNKYVFILSTIQGSKDYYVFKADGSLFPDGKKYLEVQEYWEASKNTNVIDHVSGWAGPDLLVTYTTKDDGTGSAAYWFVVSTRKFMQVREL